MITATVQHIVDRAFQELGLPTETLVVGVMGQNGEQALALLNSLGDDLVRVHDWQFLEGVHTVTGDGTTTEFDLPTDFGRVVNQTVWDYSDRMRARGPVSAQEWGWVKYGIVSVGTFFRYRILGNKFVVFPTPAVGEELKFFYIKKNWVTDDDTVTMKDAADGPNDVPVFDRNLLVKGLKLRVWAQKGFDTTVLATEFDYILTAEKGQNSGAGDIRLSAAYDSILIDPLRNIPDGDW